MLRTVWGPEHGADGRLDTNLLAAADHPIVGPVARRRIEYTAGLLRAAGVDATEAHRRATLNYTAFVGHAVLSARMPSLMPRDPGELDRQIDTVLSVLLAGTEHAPAASRRRGRAIAGG